MEVLDNPSCELNDLSKVQCPQDWLTSVAKGGKSKDELSHSSGWLLGRGVSGRGS